MPVSLVLSVLRMGVTPMPRSRSAPTFEDAGAERYTDVIAPAWTSYAGEARRFIAAARAMGLLE